MKRLIAICLAMLMCLSMFAACGDKTQTPTDTTQGTNASTEDKGNATEAPEATESEKATDEDSEGSEGSEGSEEGSDAPVVEKTGLELAQDNIRILYNSFLKNNKTGTDYTLVPQVSVVPDIYTIVWSVNTDKVTVTVSADGKTVNVDVNEDALEDLEYTLTATITSPTGETAEVSFNLVVPKFKVNTFAEYAAAEDEANVAVQGIITGVFSKATGSKANGLYIQDEKNEGGYYVYNLADDPNGVLLPGMTVLVRGVKDIYNGTHEVVDAAVQVIDDTIKPVTPVDYTELLAKAEKLSDAALVEKQALLVTVKGVTIKEAGDNGYYYFQAGNHKVYLRISSSNNATTKEAIANIEKVHAENLGNIADVTGVISVYNGNFYLSPVSADAFSNIVEPERNDAEKVDFEIAGISVDTAVTLNKVLELPTKGVKYENVTITWTSNNACAVVDGGKVTITLPEEAAKVTLTAVFTIGEVTKTVTYDIEVAAAPTVVPSVVTAPEAGVAYKFFLTQENLGKNLYFTGAMNGYYFATTDDYTAAMDVYVEVVDGGYKLYFMKGEEKTYISIVKAMGDDGKEHINVVFTAATPSVYAFNTEYNTFTTDIEGTVYYLGTYGTYNTISASKFEKIATSFAAHLAVMVDKKDCTHAYSGDCDATCNNCNAEREATGEHTWTNDCDAECDVCKATRTPADHVYTNDCDKDCDVCGATRITEHKDEDGNKLCDVCNANLAIAYDVVSTPVANKAYKIFYEQTQLGLKLYFDGTKSSYYANTTNDEGKAVDVYIEEADGGFYIYFLDAANNNAKTYIEAFMSGTYCNLKFTTDTPASVFVMDADINAPVVTLGEKTYFLGTYGDKTDIRPSEMKYASQGNYIIRFVGEICTHYYVSDCDTKCEFCDATRVAADHEYTDSVTAPTCQDKGFTTHTCSKCGDVKVDTETDTVEHKYVDGNCQWCGVAAHEHSYTSDVTPPTCTAQGYTTYTCAVCEHSYVDDYTDKIPHTYENPQITPPTCTAAGKTTETCTACGDVKETAGEAATGHKDENGDFKCDVCTKVAEPAADSNLTIAQALALATAMGNNYTTNKYYITGRIVDISNSFYGNFNIVDAEGTKLYVYGLKDSTGGGNFSGLDPQPAVGDEITIYTVVGCYQGTPQAKDAWLDELVQHTEHTYADATCKVAKTCTICGKVDGEPLDHTYVDGVCTGCGKNEPAQGTTVTNTEPFAGLTQNGQYKTVTTTSGWTAENAAVLVGGTKDANPVFQFIGSDSNTVAITLNGKTSAVGKLTSATLNNGISNLSFNYGHAFSEANGVDITINIKKGEEVVATTRLDNNSVTQKTAYEFTWELDTVVEGEFVIEIVNNSPSNSSSGNKDRISIFNFTWDSAPIAAN